jgi:hypothetical protein
MCAFVLFLVGHVTMVVITGFVRNMNHIVVGTDDVRLAGVYLGAVGIGVIIAVNVLATWFAWHRPRLVQHVSGMIVAPLMGRLLDRGAPVAEFRREDISPFFWPNGKLPTCEEWSALQANEFKDYRLKVHGLVENPVELSLEELRGLNSKSQITLHHCIQGWSGIAEWSGVPLGELMQFVRPRPDAKAVVFHSFGDGVAVHEKTDGVRYYDSLSIADAQSPQTMLAFDMNGQPLTALHGAPLRLRVENQLGFKMVKWIQSIEFVEDIRSIGQGEGGFAEDYEYFGWRANI